MIIKNYTWYMKSRGKFDTIRGVEEYGDFKSRKWIDQKGNACHNVWNIDEGHPVTAVNCKVREA